MLLLLQKRGGDEELGAGGVVPFLRVSSGDHGVKFLSELNGLGNLTVIVGGHRRWWHDTPMGGAAHWRCSGRREGGRPLGLERSRSEKNICTGYHVRERCADKY
jgi:hypothetical protein